MTSLFNCYVGSFDNIPAYDPSETSCSDATTSTNIFVTSTHTALQASTLIDSWTTTPVQTITSHVQPPSPTSNGKSDNGDIRTIILAVGVSVAATLILIVVAAIICVLLRLHDNYNM